MIDSAFPFWAEMTTVAVRGGSLELDGSLDLAAAWATGETVPAYYP